MKKETKILVLMLLGIFLLPIMARLVLAQIYTTGNPTEFIKTWFSQWQAGNLDINVAKFLFFALIAFVVYSVLSAMKFPPQDAIRWILAAIISFLATAFITPKEVFSMLTSYTALGLTLGIILPFIIILFFSIGAIRTKQPSAILIQIAVWWMFFAFLIYRLIVGMITKQADPAINAIIGVTALVTFIIATANKSVRNFLLKLDIEVGEEAAKKGASEIVEGAKVLAKTGETAEDIALQRQKYRDESKKGF